MRRTRRAALAATLGGLLALGPLFGAAEARDMGTLATMSPDNREHEEEFPPIPGIYPYQGAHAFAYFRPPMCAQQVYCDTHEIDFKIPRDYETIYGIEITLSWPRHEDNQLTLHLWGDDGPATGGSLGPCSNPKDEECMGEHPLSKRMVEPAPAGAGYDDPEDEDVEDPRLWLTVVNSEGANTGYTLSLEWFEVDLGEMPGLPDDTGPSGDAAPHRGPPAPPPAEPEGPEDLYDFEEGHEEERPEILVPGEDGELTSFEVPLMASEDAAAEEPGGVSPWITALVAIPIVGGVAFYLIRRRRAEA